MHAKLSAGSIVTPNTNVVLTGSLPRIKKGQSLLLDVGCTNSNSSSHKGMTGIKQSSHSVALSAAAGPHEAKAFPNGGVHWTPSLRQGDAEEESTRQQHHHHQQQQQQQRHQNQQQNRLHPLHDFENLYKVRKQLGCGSYSIVFEVIDRVTRERKAAKFIVRKEDRLRGRQKKRNGSGVDSDKEKDRVKAAEGEYCGNSTQGTKFGSGSSPTLSEAIVKEIAVSLTVQHRNLVSTSDVFVHDVDDLQLRLKAYLPNLMTVPPSVVKRSSNSDVACVAQKAPPSQQSFSRTAFQGSCSRGSGSSPSEQFHSTLLAASPSQAPMGTGIDSGRSAVDQLRCQLRDGQVQCILVMDLLSGCDLFSLVSRAPLSERRAATYMFDLLKALQYLHAHCVVHRDVKVENIVVDCNNNAHLIDYGFCEVLNWRNESDVVSDGSALKVGDGLLTQFCGSHHYMAPEVIRSAVRLYKPPRLHEVREPGNLACVRLPPILSAPRKSLCNIATTLTGTRNDPDSESRVMCSAVSSRSLQALLGCRQVGYGTSADMWSVGVVMFVLLHSAFPYHDDRRSKLLKMIMTGHEQVRPSLLLSEAARDLLQLLLKHDIRHRLTAAQALEHPWFKKQLGG